MTEPVFWVPRPTLDVISACRFGSTTHNQSAVLVIHRPLLNRLLKYHNFSNTAVVWDLLLRTWYSRSASWISSAIAETARTSLWHSSYPCALTRSQSTAPLSLTTLRVLGKN